MDSAEQERVAEEQEPAPKLPSPAEIAAIVHAKRLAEQAEAARLDAEAAEVFAKHEKAYGALLAQEAARGGSKCNDLNIHVGWRRIWGDYVGALPRLPEGENWSRDLIDRLAVLAKQFAVEHLDALGGDEWKFGTAVYTDDVVGTPRVAEPPKPEEEEEESPALPTVEQADVIAAKRFAEKKASESEFQAKRAARKLEIQAEFERVKKKFLDAVVRECIDSIGLYSPPGEPVVFRVFVPDVIDKLIADRNLTVFDLRKQIWHEIASEAAKSHVLTLAAGGGWDVECTKYCLKGTKRV